MKQILISIVKAFLLRTHGRNRLVTYHSDPFLELPLKRRLTAMMLKDGKIG